MRHALIGLLLASVGCGYTVTNTKDPPQQATALSPEARRAGELAALEQRQRESADLQEHHRQVLARNQAGREERKTAKLQEEEQQLATRCGKDLPLREAEMRRMIAARENHARLERWEAEHCTFEDHAKETVHVVQNGRGEISLVQHPDRDINRVCNAKPPKELEHTWVRFVPRYAAPDDLEKEIKICRAFDTKESETAQTYWEGR